MVVSDMKKALRVGKIFVDWSQNDEHKTTINVYSLRAREHPTVSTPVTWEEVEKCLKKKDADLLVFDSKQVLSRVEKIGDIFASVLMLKQHLPKVGELADAEARPGSRRSAAPARAKTGQVKKRARKEASSSGQVEESKQAGETA